MRIAVLFALLVSPAFGWISMSARPVSRRAALLGTGSAVGAVLVGGSQLAHAGSLLDLELKTPEEKESDRPPVTRMEINKAAKEAAKREKAAASKLAGKTPGFNPRAAKAPAQF